MYVEGGHGQVDRTLTLNKQIYGYIGLPNNSDVWSFSGAAGQQVRLIQVGASDPGIAFDLTGPDGWSGFSNLTAPSDLVNLPQGGTYNLNVRSTSEVAIQTYTFKLQETSQIALTPGDAYPGFFVGSGQAQLFRIVLTQASPVRITLDDSVANNVNELYAKFGAPPTRGDFGYRSTTSGASDQRILVPMAYAGTWYVLVYGDTIRTPGPYTLTAETAALMLETVTPDHHGSATDAVLTITGAGFDPETLVVLVGAGGTAYSAEKVALDSLTQLTATFAANSVPAGKYDLALANLDGTTAKMANAFEVIGGGEAKLKTNVVLPSSLGYHMPATLYVEYSNTGDVAMPAPLLYLSATQNDKPGAILTLDVSRLVKGFWTASIPDGFSNSVQFLASGQISGTLQPGESRRMPVYYAGWQQPWDMSYPQIQFSMGIRTTDDTNRIDWVALEDSMRPDGLTPEQWEPVFNNLVGQVGTTWGEYVTMLDDNARYLHELGERVTDIRELLAFETMQASGLTITRTLAAAVDAQVQAPSLPLIFSRTFSTDIPQHFRLGRFGRGWSDNWEWSLSVAYDVPGLPDQPGTVTISGPGGSRRVFQPDSRHGRPYQAQPGDHAVLTPVGNGAHALDEVDGTLRCFRVDGKLDYVQDTHDNRITCVYEGNLLIGLAHSAGPFLAIYYTPFGCVSAITDSLDRTTSFTYDASGSHLVLATDYRGLTYAYDYYLGQGQTREHALKEVVRPDGSRASYTYDDGGRLESQSGGCNGGCITTYAYGPAGEVTATDALGNATTYSVDHRGLLARIRDGLGNADMLTYDDRGQMIETTDAAGRTRTFAYDVRGNQVAETDALGYTTRYAYNGPFNQLSKITDGNGNVTLYTYGADGDLASITDAAGHAESWAYDSQGNRLSWTNRRGQTIQYTHDALGRVTQKRYPDGSIHTFIYDARGNLTRYSDTTGTTSLEFDASDRLTKITYPVGQWLAYTYDMGRRRASMQDQLGHRTDYHYDEAGRLESLSDEAGKGIVRYAYDAAGRMILKTLGNSVYTTYTYDAAGQITELSNFKPDGSVLSSFAYTYDSRGRRTTMTTTYGVDDPRASLAGTWSYDYDDTGQLVAWTAPWGRRVEYTYDALGNRLNVQDDGINTIYSLNNLNQYTQVGNSTCEYDTDGNLTMRSSPEGITTYTWSPDNRLVAVSAPGVDWQNSWNAIGNRTRISDNGIMKDYVIDPSGLGNVVGEYIHATTSLSAHYDHGLGLVSQSDAGGSAAYYTFDAIGNAHELTTASGTLANTYTYVPFGALLQEEEARFSPFKFVGESGVMAESNGLEFMRARYYDAQTGRFLSPDPIGAIGGDTGLHLYVSNDPISHSDPSGLSDEDKCNVMCVTVTELTAVLGCSSICAEVCLPFGPAWLGCVPACIAACNVGHAIAAYYYCTAICKLPPPPPPPPGSPPSPPPGGPGGNIPPIGPKDPNKKFGPSGQGTAHFVTVGSLLPYTVEFENDPKATAPAQIVTITDQLNENLDWSTFELTEIGFGDTLIPVPAGSQHFETTVPMTFDGVDFEVSIEAGIHLATGKIYASFYSIDPATNLPPAVGIGFLPPEPAHLSDLAEDLKVEGRGRGTGHFSYTVKPKADTPSGTEIRNVAYITFDGAETIATNQVDPHDPSQGTDPTMECLNTIDGGAPTSSVAVLPAEVETGQFIVSWSGQDDLGGSGVGSYDVYVSQDGGAWQIWQDDTEETSAEFSGEVGHTYSFYSLATDDAGHTENSPGVAQAQTAVVNTNVAPSISLRNTTTWLPENTDTSIQIKVADIVIRNDASGTSVLSLSGADAALFELDGPVLYLKAGIVLDHEAKPQLNVTVAVDDPTVGTTPDDTANLSVAVTNIKEAGDLDVTFGSGGKVITDLGRSDDSCGSMVLQPDGKILVAGYTFNPGAVGADAAIAVVRYITAGSLDPTFGTGGWVTTVVESFSSDARSIALQPDGKIVVVGSTSIDGKTAIAVVRYYSNGVLDATFGGRGWVTTSLGSFRASYGQSVVVQRDGKIVVAGTAYSDGGSSSDFVVVRYESNGSLDPTFGTGGWVATDIGSSTSDTCSSVALQPEDGKIVVVGSTYRYYDYYPYQDSVIAVVRYNTDGSLDTSFDKDGKVTTGIRLYSGASCVALQPEDGKIVVAGSTRREGGSGEFALVRCNSDGSLDTSFDEDGKVTTVIGSYGGGVSSVVLLPDGKILVAGAISTMAPTRSDIAVLRYNANGSLDVTFGAGGLVTTDLGSVSDSASSVAVQPDGKIVVAGRTHTSNSDVAVVRYEGEVYGAVPPAIALVNTTTSLAENTNTTSRIKVADIVVTNDGAGTTTLSLGGEDAALFEIKGTTLYLKADAALDFETNPQLDVTVAVDDPAVGATPDDMAELSIHVTDINEEQAGELDLTFGVDGKAITGILGIAYGQSVTIQQDGKVVVAGYSSDGSGAYDFAVVRYNVDGALDPDFDADGMVTTDLGSPMDQAYSVALQPDGKIVAVGRRYRGVGTGDIGAVRYNVDGSLDTTFGADGRVITSIGSIAADGESVAIQPDGKIVVAASTQNGIGGYDIAVVRYKVEDGSLDPDFGPGGWVTTDLGPDDHGRSVAIQTDGKIVVAGYAQTDKGNYDFAVVRYDNDGSLDATFGAGGWVITEIGSSADYGQSVAIQPDGKIVVVGSGYCSSNSDMVVVRYDSDGSLDPTFGSDGKVILYGGYNDYASGVALQQDGKIVVVGSIDNIAGFADFGIVRFNSDGSLDTSFSGDGKVTTAIDAGPVHDFGQSIAIQSDGKIVVAGTTNDTRAVTNFFAVVRYQGGP